MARPKETLEDLKSILKKESRSTYTDQVFNDSIKSSIPFQNKYSSNPGTSPLPPTPTPPTTPSPTAAPTPAPTTAAPTPSPTAAPTTPAPTAFVDRTLFAKFNTF
jgi:hypothetical protein